MNGADTLAGGPGADKAVRVGSLTAKRADVRRNDDQTDGSMNLVTGKHSPWATPPTTASRMRAITIDLDKRVAGANDFLEGVRCWQDDIARRRF